MKDYAEEMNWQQKPITIITHGDISLYLEYRSVEVKGVEINLTTKEFDILALLMMNPRRVFTYEMITDVVWKEDFTYFSRKAINNHISNLRKKIGAVSNMASPIKSVHSIGYKFDIQ